MKGGKSKGKSQKSKVESTGISRGNSTFALCLLRIAECDPRRSEEVRRNWPFLRDRRIEAYAPILQRLLI